MNIDHELISDPAETICGPSILQALKRSGRDPGAVDFVLLSHLHGDHFGGVPFLFMEYRYEEPRSRPLRSLSLRARLAARRLPSLRVSPASAGTGSIAALFDRSQY